jgi:hypothetical protein
MFSLLEWNTENFRLSAEIRKQNSLATTTKERKEEIFHLDVFSTSCLNKWKMIPGESWEMLSWSCCFLPHNENTWHVESCEESRSRRGGKEQHSGGLCRISFEITRKMLSESLGELLTIDDK